MSLALGSEPGLFNGRDHSACAALLFAHGAPESTAAELAAGATAAAVAVARARVFGSDFDPDTPLCAASAAGDESAVAALLSSDAAGTMIDAPDNYGASPLICASFGGHEGVVRALLARGANQELQSKNGSTALRCAIKEGHAGVVAQLCDARGAATVLALRDKQGRTPLCAACLEGTNAVISALLAADALGTTVDVPDSNGSTPLAHACFRGNEATVRLLLSHGAKLELQDILGCTALHRAVWCDFPGILVLLCSAPDAAAALALRNRSGRTPLALAMMPNTEMFSFGGETIDRSACADVLRAHGAPE